MLPRSLKARALREAQERGVSMGELIRQALGSVLGGGDDDRLLGDAAVYDGPAPADSAEHHDEVLYGPAKRR